MGLFSETIETSPELLNYIFSHMIAMTPELPDDQLKQIAEFISQDGNSTLAENIQFLINLKKDDQKGFEDRLELILIYVLRNELLEAINGSL